MSFRIGQPVYIGYCPDRDCVGGSGYSRCQPGTILDGPLQTGDTPWYHDIVRIPGRSWAVQPDTGSMVIADEKIIFPMGGDDQGKKATARKKYEIDAA